MKIKYYSINDGVFSVRCKLCYNDLHAVDAVVIAFHGFGGHKDNRAAERFADRALSRYPHTALLSFDLPCHGEDGQKKLSLAACDRYITLVLNDVREKYPEAELYAYATSFGAWLCLKYLQDHGNPFRKIVLRCPSLRMLEAMQVRILSSADLEKLGKNREVLAGFDRKVKISSEFMRELETAEVSEADFLPFADDLLILHGTKDEIIPIAYSRDFADRNVIELIEVKNADHRFSDPQIMNQAIADSLKFLFESGEKI
ncbi:MAG: alpha/beta fold hydrolase [Oscillospiraceae bacterium]|nr:alpha/beta fold hydrolase [Oscillospiraceae bacterium]